jgi:hypothetical protein
MIPQFLQPAIQAAQSKWAQMNDPKYAADFNDRMKQSMVNGGMMMGDIQPMGSLQTAADILTGTKNAGAAKTLEAVDVMKPQAQRQLLYPQYQSFLKDPNNENIITAIIKRAKQETNGGISNAVDSLKKINFK